MITKVYKLTLLKKLAISGKYCFLAMVFSLIAFSCIEESSKVIDKFKGEEKEVIFSINIPSANDVTPQLRSINLAQENTIQRVDLVAFHKDNTGSYFDYYYQGTLDSNKTPGESTQNCRVKVRLASYAQDLVIITNAGTRVIDLINSGSGQGTSKEDFLARLEYVLPKAGNTWYAVSASDYDAIPMWGETSTTVTQNTTQLSVSLLRMLAKIDVQLDVTNSAAIKSVFKMKSVSLYNTLTNGRIAPNSSNIRQPGDSVIAPSLPTAPANYVGPLVYQDFTAPGTPDVAMKGAIYLFETKAPVTTDSLSPLSATCVVIGGLYTTDTAQSYYRVDFLKNGKFQDILRNHRYLVNITSVTGRGYPTPDEAYRNKAVNMGVYIIVWDEGNTYNVDLK